MKYITHFGHLKETVIFCTCVNVIRQQLVMHEGVFYGSKRNKLAKYDCSNIE